MWQRFQCYPGHTLFGQSREDGLHRLGDSLNAIAEFAARYQMRVAIEPADRYETDLLQDCATALELLNQLGYDNLGVLMDNGHVHIVGESEEEAIRLLGNKLFHVHINDNFGVRDQHLVPGDGNCNFTPLMEALRREGYSGFLGVELSWDYVLDPDQASRLSFERLNKVMH